MMKLVKLFQFSEPEYPQMVVSDSSQIGINFLDHYATLKKQTGGKYDVEADVADARWIRTRVTTPTKGRGLLLMSAECSAPEDTYIGFLLGDGTDAYKYSGGSWVVADPDLKTDYMTEAEINSAIQSFPSTTSFCVYVRLGTDDPLLTPECVSLSILYNVDILAWDESVFKQTLAIRMENDVRPVTDIQYVNPATGTTLSFTDIVADVEETLTLEEPVQVFNLEDDPDLETDLFSSYDSGTKVITLTGSVPLGKQLLIRATMVLPVTIESGHVDWIELSRSPSITLYDAIQREYHSYETKPYVVDKANKRVQQLDWAKRNVIGMTCTVTAPTKYDLYRSQDEILRFLEANRLLMNEEIDEGISVVVTSAFKSESGGNLKAIFTSSLDFDIFFNIFAGTATERYMVETVNLTTTTEA